MTKRARMLVRSAAAIACGSVALVTTTPLGATPGSGASSTILARGRTSDDIKLHVKGDNDFVFAQVTIQPGGYTGWHFHPGPLLVAVQSGTLTRYNADCQAHTHQAGQSFIEPAGDDDVHMGVNNGSDTVVLLVTYVVPADGPLRLEAPAPQCAASLDPAP